jgi:hypothetical protein
VDDQAPIIPLVGKKWLADPEQIMFVLLIKRPVWVDASVNEVSPSIIEERWEGPQPGLVFVGNAHRSRDTKASQCLISAVSQPSRLVPFPFDCGKQHGFVVAQQADNLVGGPLLKVDQQIQNAAAVWAAIDVIAKEDEPASILTGVLLALFNEALQLRQATVGVADRISAGHSTTGPQ